MGTLQSLSLSSAFPSRASEDAAQKKNHLAEVQIFNTKFGRGPPPPPQEKQQAPGEGSNAQVQSSTPLPCRLVQAAVCMSLPTRGCCVAAVAAGGGHTALRSWGRLALHAVDGTALPRVWQGDRCRLHGWVLCCYDSYRRSWCSSFLMHVPLRRGLLGLAGLWEPQPAVESGQQGGCTRHREGRPADQCTLRFCSI